MVLWLAVITVGVLLSPLISRYKREIALLLLLVLPVLKDGPLDIDIWQWKFAIVSAFLLISLSENNPVTKSLPYAKSIVLVIISAFVTLFSYLLNNTPEVGTDIFLAFLTSVLFFASLCRIFDNRLLRTGIRAFAVITAAACLLTFLQYAVIRFNLSYPALVHLIPPEMKMYFFEQGHTLDWRGIRLPSFFFHSNQLGHFLVVSFGFMFPLLFYSKKIRNRMFYMMILLLITMCILLTQSRGSLLLILITAAITIAFNASDYWKKHKGLLILLLSGIVVVLIILLSHFTYFLERITSLSLSYREKNWSYALQLMPRHILFGVGPGCSSYHILLHFPVVQFEDMLNAYLAKQPFNYWMSNPHNYYINTVLETGVFSLIVQLMLFGSVMLMGVRQVLRARHSLYRALSLGATIVLVMEFVRGVFEAYNFLSAPETGALIAFLFALLLYLNSWRGRTVLSE